MTVSRVRAFTLVELLLAVFLSAMIMLSFAAIYANSYRWFRSTVQTNIKQTGLVSAVETMVRDLEKTTFVYWPQSPCPLGNCTGASTKSFNLEGCTNFDPNSTSYNHLDPAQGSRLYSYCVDGSNQMWYTWLDYASNTAAPCNPAPTLTCGTSLFGSCPGTNCMQLATNVVSSPLSFHSAACQYSEYFCRPLYKNNVVEMDFVVSGATVNTHVGLEMSVLSPG